MTKNLSITYPQFLENTKDHALSVMHEDGLYRHLRMEWNYDETLKSAEEIIKYLGFTTEMSEKGLTISEFEENKVGDEKHFFEALAPLSDPTSHLEWRGSDNEMWRWEIREGKMIELTAKIVWG